MEKQMKKNIPNDEELKKYIHKNRPMLVFQVRCQILRK